MQRVSPGVSRLCWELPSEQFCGSPPLSGESYRPHPLLHLEHSAWLLRALGLKEPGLEGLAQPLANREVTEPLWASVATSEDWTAQ